MKTPKEIADEIVDQFSWSANVMRNGKLIGLQYIVADTIARAIETDRRSTLDRAAELLHNRARALVCKRRTNQCDRHTSEVLARARDDVRGLADIKKAQDNA